MAFLKIKNVSMVGVAAGVPNTVVDNLTMQERCSLNYDNADFCAMTGINRRRFSRELTTSDLCYGATLRLMQDLNWERDTIDAVIVVSQTLDYILPATACIMQDRLGLSRDCYAEDVQLGCSGWVYGLSTIAALMQTGGIRRALLMAGDAKAHVRLEKYKELHGDPLFGSAGTVTALEYDPEAPDMLFNFGTDGSGYDAIITPEGGARHPFTEHSFDEEEIEGRTYTRLDSRMKGMDVFAFGISTAPKAVKRLAREFDFDYLTADYFVFHQANKKMNDIVYKKLKLPDEKILNSMREFGNTSSASIPMSIVASLNQGKTPLRLDGTKQLICTGYGVGLSWGSVALTTHDLLISPLVEMGDERAGEGCRE